MTTYTNSHAQFDCAIDGVPFFLGPTPEFPYTRQTAEFQRQQIDQSNEPGEQSLTGWWYRSQSSFHLGAGLKFFDPIRGNPTSQFRFYDSAGVDVWTEGEVRLLRKATQYYSMSTWGSMCTWAYNGADGLLVEDSAALKVVSSDGTTGTFNFRGGSAPIFDIDTTGSMWIVSDNDGLWTGSLSEAKKVVTSGTPSTGTKQFSFPGAVDRSRVRWVKERLYLAANESIYELDASPASPPAALPTDYTGTADGRLLYTHPESDWRWMAIEPGPDCIFFAGYSGAAGVVHGNRSSVYAATVEVANIDDIPQVTQPAVVAEMPYGEYITSMASYLGTYLILGTTKGVRVCLIGDNGSLRVGPLTIEQGSEDKVNDVTVWDRFVYATDARVDGYWGVFKIDLSAPIDQTGLRFAYAKDVASTTTSATGNVARVAMLGRSGRCAFMVNGSGLWVEHATDLVTEGWIRTGLIRMDTWTDKVFQYLRSAVDANHAGTVRPYWLTEGGSATALAAATSTSGVSKLDTAGSDGVPRLGLSYKFVLARDSAAVGPRFQGYQVRCLPANVRQRDIRLPLLCYRKERTKGGRTVTRPVWDRIEAVEALERTGQVVAFQDFATGESRFVTVEKVQFVADRPAQNRAEAANPGGMLLVTLRSAD